MADHPIDSLMKRNKYIHRIIDLDGGPISETLAPTFFNGEQNEPHMFVIELRQEGKRLSNYSYSNSDVSGRFLNAKDQTVPITGNYCRYISDYEYDITAIVVTLPSGCYNVPGPFTLTLSLRNAVVYKCQSYVDCRSSDVIYDPDDAITMEELINEIREMRTVASEARNAAGNANTAADHATAVAENVDIDMTEQTGSATITITRPDGTQKTQTINVTTDDASIDLIYDERLLNNGQYVVTAADMESGSWVYSRKANNTKKLRNRNLIPVSAGMQISYSTPTLRLGFWVLASKTATGSFAQTISFQEAGSSGVINITANGYLMIIAESVNDITVNDYDCEVKIFTENAFRYVNVNSLSAFGVSDFPANSFTYTKLSDSHVFTDKPEDLSDTAYVYISNTPINSSKSVSIVTVYDVLNEITYRATYRKYTSEQTPAKLWPWKKMLTNDDASLMQTKILNIEDEISNIDGNLSAIFEYTSNLFEMKKLVGYSDDVSVTFDADKFTIENATAGTYKRANFDIKLEPNTMYTLSAIKHTISGASGIYYIESEDGGSTYPSPFSELISYTENDDAVNSATFITTTGYIRLSFFCTSSESVQGKATFSNVMLSKGTPDSSYVPPITATDVIARKALEPKLNVRTCNIFKRVLCIGDSYTEGYINTNGTGRAYKEYSWPTYMEQKTGNKWINCGVSGATSLTWQTRPGGLAAAQAAGVVQAYIVMLMINDALTGSVKLPIGTIADVGDESPTTYYGAYSKVIREIHNISPNAIIFVCTCPYLPSIPSGYQQAVRDIAELYASNYNVHLLDMKANSHLFDDKSLRDDFINHHYTALGYEQFAEIYAYFISKYINEHVSAFQNVHLIPYDTTE